jgi:hypothetical protein
VQESHLLKLNNKWLAKPMENDELQLGTDEGGVGEVYTDEYL